LSVFEDLRKSAAEEFDRVKRELESLYNRHLEELKKKLEEIKSRYSKDLSRLE